MSCPKLIDNTRMCLKEVNFAPPNTFSLCTSEKHKTCPFYLLLTDEMVCKNIKCCPAFKRFSMFDTQQFLDITHKYCVSEKNHTTCQRYILKEAGDPVPLELNPNGSTE
jgi:hypothetical protein